MIKEKTTAGIAITALLISLGLGGNILLDNPNSLENWYICTSSLETGEFVRLSGTLYTGYPNELDNKDYQRCIDDLGNKGVWESIISYAEENNVDINTLIPIDDEIEETPKLIQIPNNQNKITCIKGGCY